MHTRKSQSSRLVALPLTQKRPRQLPVSPEVTGVQDQSQSPLMGLSSEMRNRIYELAFEVTCEVPSGHKGNPKGLTVSKNSQSPTLKPVDTVTDFCLVCRRHQGFFWPASRPTRRD